MAEWRQQVVVGSNHQVVLNLPADVPEGPVEVIVRTPGPAYPPAATAEDVRKRMAELRRLSWSEFWREVDKASPKLSVEQLDARIQAERDAWE